MATPTRAEVQAQITAATKILDSNRTNGLSVSGFIDAYIAILEGDNSGTGPARSIRATLSDTISLGSDIFGQHFLDMAKVILSPALSIDAIMDDLYQNMIDNSLSVNSRNLTFGTPAAGGGNVGDAIIYRITEDESSLDIESGHLALTTAKVTQDSNQGRSVGEESWEFSQGYAGIDLLDSDVSPDIFNIQAVSADNLLRNGSFFQRAGTNAAPTSITGWTSSVVINGTNYEFDPINFFRQSPSEKRAGDSDPAGDQARSLNVKVTAELSQKSSDIGITFSEATPYMLAVRWNRAIGAATGTLTVHLGSQSESVVVLAQAGWNTLTIIDTSQDQSWYKNFKEDDLDIKIAWASTGGELLIDDVLFGPCSQYDANWVFIAGGATNSLSGDINTWTDALTATEGTNQYWFAREFGRYLPHNNAGAETWADY